MTINFNTLPSILLIGSNTANVTANANNSGNAYLVIAAANSAQPNDATFDASTSNTTITANTVFVVNTASASPATLSRFWLQVKDNSGARNTDSVLGLTSHTGFQQITLGTPNTNSAFRIVTSPDVVANDIIDWGNVIGSGNVYMANDATFSADVGVTAFDVYVGTLTDGWGNVATQNVASGYTFKMYANGTQTVYTSVSNIILTGAANVSGTLNVGGYDLPAKLNAAYNAANSASVKTSANGGSLITSGNINFVNTSTVSVSVTSGINGNANVAFTSTAGGSGTVTSVNTGLGLTGGPVTTTGTISANLATTSVQGISKLVDSISSTDTANAATANAVKWGFESANANALLAYAAANSAYIKANTSANTVAVFANGTLTLASANVNFNNTGTINVSSTANGTGQVNVAFSVNTAAMSGGGAYQADVLANGTLVLANANLNFINTSTMNVNISANGSSQANIGFDYNPSGQLGIAIALKMQRFLM